MMRCGPISTLSVCLLSRLLLSMSYDVARAKPLTSEESELYYTMGVRMSTDLAIYDLSPEAIDKITEGLKDGHRGALKLDPGPVFDRLKAHLMRLVDQRAAEESTKGHAFFKVFQAKPGVKMSPRGAAYLISKEGTGRTPTRKEVVQVHYEGRTVDGVIFDSSRARTSSGVAKPVPFPLDQVVPCWTDVLPLIKEGSRVQLVCPSQLAYGKRGAPPIIPPGATLVFDIEFFRIGLKQTEKERKRLR